MLIGDLSISVADRRLRAATHGQGVYERDLLGGSPPGAIPDGDSIPGQPLTAVRLPGGDLTLSWDRSCALGDGDYAVYEGTIGDFTGHLPRFCSTGGATSKTFTPSEGNRYYLVVPRNLANEGSYGVDGTNLPRPPSAEACLPQQVGSCAVP